MTESDKVVIDFIDTLVAAWPAKDAAKPSSFFSSDAVYHNIPMDPINGREAIEATLATFMAMSDGVDFEMINMLSNGPIVMTERVDKFITGGKTISLPVMGTFEVHNGTITAWRDYFDLNQFTSQMSG